MSYKSQPLPLLTPLPCPFCGKMPSTGPKRPEIEGGAWGYVACHNRRCTVRPSVGDGADIAYNDRSGWYIDRAIKKWNKRP